MPQAEKENLDSESDARRKMVSSVQLTLQSPLSATARLFPSPAPASAPAPAPAPAPHRGQKEKEAEAPILPPSAFMSGTSTGTDLDTSPAGNVDDQPLYSVPIKKGKGHSRQKPVSSASAASNLMAESFKPQVVDAQARATVTDKDKDFMSSFQPLPPEPQPKPKPQSTEVLYAEINHDHKRPHVDATSRPVDPPESDLLSSRQKHDLNGQNDAGSYQEIHAQGGLERRNSSEDIVDEFSPGSLKSDVSRGFESSETLLSIGNSGSEGNDFDHNCDSGIQLDKPNDMDQRPDLNDMKFADEEDEAEMKDSGVFLKQVGWMLLTTSGI